MAAEPQNPTQAIDVMSSVTATHLVLMAVLALAAVLTIWWGTVLYLRRRAAKRQVQQDYDTADAHGALSEPVAGLGEGAATLSADVPDPVPAAPPAPVAVPAPEVGAAPATAPEGTALATDLTQIKGLGPKLVAMLAEQGITRVEQIAALTPQAAAQLDARLGTFQGRMTRDRWIEQAKLLSAGDRAGYESAFGKLGG